MMYRESRKRKSSYHDAAYDEWSLNMLKNHSDKLRDYKHILSMCDDADVVFADMSEGMLALTDEQLDRFRPDDDYNSAIKFLKRVARGDYNGYYCSVQFSDIGDKLMEDLEQNLLMRFPNIRRIVKNLSYHHLAVMDNTKILEMKAEIVFKKDKEDDGEEWEYGDEEYLLPIFVYLREKGVHMKRVYENKCTKVNAEERSFPVTFWFNVSNK